MVANMAGSGVQERVRVSAVRVRGKRRACAITGGLPCRRTRRSSMSEYRPGVTSPHTLPQRASPPPPATALFPSRRTPSHRAPHSICLSSLPHPLSTRSSTPTTSQRTSNVALLRRLHSLTLYVPTRFLSVSSAASFHVILFSHYPGLSCLRCSSDPLSSLLFSHRPPPRTVFPDSSLFAVSRKIPPFPSFP